MKLNYKYDEGLEFIQYSSNEELNFLVDLYRSEAKLTESITSETEYKRYSPNHHRYWKLIVAELQFFGGNTLSNTARGYGVLYKQIICDVCDKVLISYDRNADVSQIEKVLIFECIKRSIEHMDLSEYQTFKEEFNFTQIEKINVIREIKKRFLTDKAFFKKIIEVLIASLVKLRFKHVAKFALPFVVNKTAAFPVSIALSLKTISDPAFRITLPSVIYIAYLREQHKERDLKFRRRFYPQLGSILRTELINGVADHSGIYIGNDQVIEITQENGFGVVKNTDLNDFVHSSFARTGSTIYIAIDRLSKDVICNEKLSNTAKKHIGKRNTYQLMKDNCHSFVHKCIINEDFVKITSLWKFEELTKSISKNLNKNRLVEWVVCDINPLEYKSNKIWKIEDEVV